MQLVNCNTGTVLYFVFVFLLQSSYYIPSRNQMTPQGKLYFKVVNLINKAKRLGVQRNRKVCQQESSFDYVDNLPQGKMKSITLSQFCSMFELNRRLALGTGPFEL
jgi:hypothetical protein